MASFSLKKEWKTAHANKNAFAAFSIPLFFVMVSGGRSPKAFLSPRAAVERSDSKGRSFGSGLRPPLRMTEATAQYDKKVLPEVRDDVVAGEGGKVGGKFRRSGFPGQGEIADDKTQ